jgi:hypothetical protein
MVRSDLKTLVRLASRGRLEPNRSAEGRSSSGPLVRGLEPNRSAEGRSSSGPLVRGLDLAPGVAATLVAGQLAEARGVAPFRLREAARAGSLDEWLREVSRRWRLPPSREVSTAGAHAFALAISEPPWAQAMRRMPADAIGLVYESLLGSSARRLGAVYTPAPLVRYVVRGALQRVSAAPVRILDPACGGGFFLLEAARALAERGLSWSRVLERLYGAEVDPCAASLARIALSLEAGVDPASAPDQVACGDAVLSPARGLERFAPLSWKERFPEVLETGGFDAVVGNPPYFGVDAIYGRKDPRLAALRAQYPEIHTDKTDLSYYFLARALQLSRGVVSFVVSRAFLEAYKAQKLRLHLAGHGAPAEVIDFRSARIFARAGVSICILTLDRQAAHRPFIAYRLRVRSLPEGELDRQLADRALFDSVSLERERLGAAPWVLSPNGEEAVHRAIDARGEPLGDVLVVGQGMQTGLNAAFAGLRRADVERLGLAPAQVFQRASNSDLSPFAIRDRAEFVLYPEACADFRDLPLGAQRHLASHRAALERRAAFLRGNCDWWRFSWPLHRALYRARRRILCPFIAPANAFALDAEDRFLSLTDTTVLFDNGQREDLRYLLGLLNSPVLEFRFRALGKLKGAGLYEYFWNSVSKLPIRRIDFSDARERALHARMVALVRASMARPGDARLARARAELAFELYEVEGAARRAIESGTNGGGS